MKSGGGDPFVTPALALPQRTTGTERNSDNAHPHSGAIVPYPSQLRGEREIFRNRVQGRENGWALDCSV